MTARESDDRPWGWWLTVTPGSAVEDEDGTIYASVRDAFWHTRLKIDASLAHARRDEVLEIMLAAMLAMKDGARPLEELDIDIFDGSDAFRAFFSQWLIQQRMLAPSPHGRRGSLRLTAEGASILAMLMVTRPRRVSGVAIGTDTIAALRSLARVVGPAESLMAATEEAVREMETGFVRDGRRGDDSVSLVRYDHGGDMPIRRTIWSLRCSDAAARDRLYAWLCDRVDRWPAWSDLAWQGGAARLTSHLLQILLADPNRTKQQSSG